MSMLAWHYTTGDCFVEIMESGVLRPTDLGVIPPERPVLWFSMNQHWEQTANKMIERDGKTRGLNMEETLRLCNGLFRLGVKPEELIPWPELAKKAKTPKKVVRVLEKTARKLGANPKEWMGTLDPITAVGRVEMMDENGEWIVME